MRFIAILIPILLLGSCDRQPALPPDVQVAVDAALKESRERGGPNMPDKPPEGMIIREDLSDDGAPDFIIDYEPIGYYGWCGTGGCRRQIFASRLGVGYELVFDRITSGVPTLHTVNGRRVLEVDLSGVWCNGAGADDCHRTLVWSDGRERFDEPNRPEGYPPLIGTSWDSGPP